ncbi:MAG: hypothetical protein DA443_00890 [Bacteroidetes bacterium]|nr:MAG: hypothetical protein DA443_00890 [Bacteroidota bacterium]
MRWLLFILFFYAIITFFRMWLRRIGFTIYQQARSASERNASGGYGGRDRTGGSEGYRGSGVHGGRAGSRGWGGFGQKRGKPNLDTIEEAEFEDITDTTSETKSGPSA